MRIIATLWLLMMAAVGMAQQLTPLGANGAVERQLRQEEADLLPYFYSPPEEAGTVKVDEDCYLPVDGRITALAGDTLRLPLPFDTTGIGPVTRQCLNCGLATGGQAFISGTRLVYIPNASAIADPDDITLTFCSVQTGECFGEYTYQVLARRRNRNYFPPMITLAPEASVTSTVDVSVLPGTLRCNFFDDCPDNYAGRDQLAYFTDYTAPDETFIYRASRFRGTDSLCVTICDDYGICDTYHYAFRVNRPSRSLPFMDDFSYAGPFTDDELWLDREVFVNNTLAVLPPSVGVATFDGVNQRGRPWGGNPGQADRLTSNYINLQGVVGMPVLTFWMQRGGLGDRPEIKDSLLLQFMLPSGQWTTVRSFAGLVGSTPATEVDSFRFVSVPVTSLFYHQNFQFRFINIADRKGMRDQWNLDYIRLDAQQTQQTFSDVAFTDVPKPIIAPYNSMPWRHFQANEVDFLKDNIIVGLYNHADQTLNASPSSVRLQEQQTGVNTLGPVTLFNAQESNVANGSWLNRAYSLINDPTFPSVWSSYLPAMSANTFDGQEELHFNMRYSLSNTSQIGGAGLESVQRNDVVDYTTVFANYFAYDDGTAETALENGPGRQVAQRFTATVADTIRGVQLNFPHTGGEYTNQEMRLRIWIGQLDNVPEYDLRFRPDHADTFFDTLQGFTSYPLIDAGGNLQPLALPPGDFYVGWQQLTNCALGSCIAVGYDRNNPDARDEIFVNNGLGWVPISGVLNGALMIRPVVGSEAPPATSTEENTASAWAPKVYPNPVSGRLFVDLPEASADHSQYTYRLFNATGALAAQGSLQPSVSVAGLPPGMYVLQILGDSHNQMYSQRIIVL